MFWRRNLNLLVILALLAGVGIAVAFWRTPYVAVSPGPTFNTLGSYHGTDLIQVEGHATYPTTGNLNMVTVNELGGPGDGVSAVQAMWFWIAPHSTLLPLDYLYPSDETSTDVTQQGVQDFTDSQSSATTAALKYLNIPVTTYVVISVVQPGEPADGKLKVGDVVVSVDGTKVTTLDEFRAGIRKHKPGEVVNIGIVRDGKPMTVAITTGKSPDSATTAYIGVVSEQKYKYPFTVTYTLQDVSGPSAGLMFAMGLVDKLTPGSLTDGHFIAGTGTIDSDGNVGVIGGIQQKMVTARRAGASVFFVPAGNCPDAKVADPQGLRLVKVSTLTQAVHYLDALNAGGSAPSC